MRHEAMAVSIVMERVRLASKWAPFKWEARGVVAAPATTRNARVMFEDHDLCQVLFEGYGIELHRDEVEDYFLNLSSPEPKVFVMWRMEGETPVPHTVTVSYGEAARLLDGGEQVDAVPIPPEIAVWTAQFVERHYKPEPKKVRKRDRRPETNP